MTISWFDKQRIWIELNIFDAAILGFTFIFGIQTSTHSMNKNSTDFVSHKKRRLALNVRLGLLVASIRDSIECLSV